MTKKNPWEPPASKMKPTHEGVVDIPCSRDQLLYSLKLLVMNLDEQFPDLMKQLHDGEAVAKLSTMLEGVVGAKMLQPALVRFITCGMIFILADYTLDGDGPEEGGSDG